MTKINIQLTQKQYDHLKNVLIWADLYDETRNNRKNAKVFSEIREGFDYRKCTTSGIR